jgi:hypothetical protein
MKTWFGNKPSNAAMIFILVMATSIQLAGQTSMGILPVDVATTGSNVLNQQQWQSVSSQLHDYLVMQLGGIGTVSKLSREHILLLIKEMPAPDPENLGPDAYAIISKKEKLQYLLKCSVGPILTEGKNIIAPVRIIIVDGNTGKDFWEDIVRTSHVLSQAEITDQILLNEVLKPSVNELANKIKSLKY